MTYGTLISSVTVGAGGAANITFTDIPQTYTDLILVLSLRGVYSGQSSMSSIELNGVTSGYSVRELVGTGSAAYSSFSNGDAAYNRIPMDANTSTANTFGNTVVYLPNYTAAINKTISVDGTAENNATATDMRLVAGLWTNTAAVTSIRIFDYNGNFMQYSTAYLYGLTKGSGGATVS